MTVGTVDMTHALCDFIPHKFAVRFFVTTLQIVDNALKISIIGTASIFILAVHLNFFSFGAV